MGYKRRILIMARKDYKVGDRVYYEVFGGGIGSGIVQKIENSSYVNDWRKVRYFKYLWLDEMTTLEDYNALHALYYRTFTGNKLYR